MAKKKSLEDKVTQAGFRLEADEAAAFRRYAASERFPLPLSDLVHRLFREFLVDEGFLLPDGEEKNKS